MESNKINVAVLFGGRSVEHEVSILSAQQAIAALDKNKYQVIPVYISKEGKWYSGDVLFDVKAFRDIPALLKQAVPVYFSHDYGDQMLYQRQSGGLFSRKQAGTRIDVALPVVHGSSVEDGCLQGFLETCGIPYACPGVLGSAVGMDKIMMKAVLREAGLPVVEYHAFTAGDWAEDAEAVLSAIQSKLHFPMIVKPANLGSSIGISRADDPEALREKIELALSFSLRILVEQAVDPLREINCAALGLPGDVEVSVCEEPLNGKEILSFEDKYLSSGSSKGMSGAKRRIPAELDAETTELIRSYTAKAFSAMDCRGVCRVDFLLDPKSNQVYVNELNTIPGSLSFYLFDPSGVAFDQLLDKMIRAALRAKRDTDRLTRVYDSNILAQGGFKGKK
ncbi:MAG: D-alanine--D-alanine ligase family protein [Bacillota bacterium]|nr:D-alanine--D-alanine ligase family protein [Bacillota bacterium]